MNKEGKPIAETSYNEITKMLYRIKDFEQVYNVSENKFKPKEEDYSVKNSIEQVLDVAKSELSKKNIDLTMNFSDGIPTLVKGDSYKFKQVMLNLIH